MSNNTSETILKAIEIIPELYHDTFQSAAKETGEVLAIIPRTVKAALIPLRKWILEKEYNFNLLETEQLLVENLKDVSPEKITTPEPYVAIPTLQAISYSMDNEQLRNLYAHLLANAMNIDTKHLVHPSFIEIIKQLSPEDASFFEQICPLKYRPIIDIKLLLFDGSTKKIAKYCNTLSVIPPSNVGITIENLIRLGLIFVTTDEFYTNEDIYTSLEAILKSKYNLITCKEKYPNTIDILYQKGRINITEYGKQFYQICVK